MNPLRILALVMIALLSARAALAEQFKAVLFTKTDDGTRQTEQNTSGVGS